MMDGGSLRLWESPCHLQSFHQAGTIVPYSLFCSSRLTVWGSDISLEWVLLEVDSVLTLNECRPTDCSGLCSSGHLSLFLSSPHSREMLRDVPLNCVVFGKSWLDELGADQDAFVPEPLLEGLGHICRIPMALFRRLWGDARTWISTTSPERCDASSSLLRQ